MPPAACSVLPSVRRASAPEMLRSTAVTTSWLCGPSSLCAEPPLGAGALGRVTWAGAGSLPGPSPSPPLTPVLLVSFPFHFVYVWVPCELLRPLPLQLGFPTICECAHNALVWTSTSLWHWCPGRSPQLRVRAHSQPPAALSPPHVAFLFRAGARGATPGTLVTGMVPPPGIRITCGTF